MIGKAILKKIPAMSAEEARIYINDHNPDSFTLLDVRLPEEYTEKHLPGAKLIPLGELHQRLDELDREIPTIVYCRSGMRAGNATTVLIKAGFSQVRNITGGILAWEGNIATGRPEACMLMFEGAERPEDFITLAWDLENGAKRFYEHVAHKFRVSAPTADLFNNLAQEEKRHISMLENLYRKITDNKNANPSSQDLGITDTLMEGGISVNKAIAWADKQMAIDILEFSLAVEVNAYDRYLTVAQNIAVQDSRRILQALAQEEKRHLDQLAESFSLLRAE